MIINPTVQIHKKKIIKTYKKKWAYSFDTEKTRGLPLYSKHPREGDSVNPLEMVFMSVSVYHNKDSHYPYLVNLLRNVYYS